MIETIMRGISAIVMSPFLSLSVEIPRILSDHPSPGVEADIHHVVHGTCPSGHGQTKSAKLSEKNIEKKLREIINEEKIREIFIKWRFI